MTVRHSTVTRVCRQCGRSFESRLSEEKYRAGQGRPKRRFCGRKCAAAAKRISKAEKVRRKAEYDVKYRAAHLAKLKAYKAAWFQRTYDPETARAERKKRMKWHVEYCRRYYADPARKAEKVEYDASRRAAKYGAYAGAARVLTALKKTITTLCPDKYERAKARGYYERNAQQRRRDAQVSRW